MIKSSLSYKNQEFTLFRYPAKRQHETLQAWGAEDEHVLNHLYESEQEVGRLLILNDDFGALGCLLNDKKPVWQQDSYIAHCALVENLERNNLQPLGNYINSVTTLNGHFDTVLIKLPKNLNLLAYQLATLQNHVTPSTQIIGFGKVKVVTSNVLKLFESVLGTTTTSLAVKKSRLIFCQPYESSITKKTKVTTQDWQVQVPNTPTSLQVTNLANVFSGQSLDIGARFMMQNLRINEKQRILDLGCGNGVLGLTALGQSPESQVTFVDESFMAVESARINVKRNFPNQLQQCRFVVDNCLDKHNSGEISQSYDTILCNPPFHQQNAVTDHIAWQMFTDAKANLRQGGRLIVVGNRHLGYHDKLKRLFGGTKVLASQPKFVILVAIKQ